MVKVTEQDSFPVGSDVVAEVRVAALVIFESSRGDCPGWRESGEGGQGRDLVQGL